MSGAANVEAEDEENILEIGQRDIVPPSRSTRASSEDFLNIMDNIVDNVDEEFDKERDGATLQPPPSLPIDAFARSFARESAAAEALEKLISPADTVLDPDSTLPITTATATGDIATSVPDDTAAPSAASAEEEEMENISSLFRDDSFISIEGSVAASDSIAGPESPPPAAKPLLKKVSLDEMVIEASRLSFDGGDAAPHEPIDKPKVKKATKSRSKKSFEADALPSISDLQLLPPLVGSKVRRTSQEMKSQDGDSDVPSSNRRRSGSKPADHLHANINNRSNNNNNHKLPPVRPAGQEKPPKRRIDDDHLDHSHEAEEILHGLRPSLPQLPHSSPLEKVQGFSRKRFGKPLYLRMQAKAMRQAAEEEQQRQEEYLRMRKERARGRVSRDELRAHMKQHDDFIQARAQEARQGHLAQIRALRRKNPTTHGQALAAGPDGEELDSQTSSLAGSPRKPRRPAEMRGEAGEFKPWDDARERRRKYSTMQAALGEKKPASLRREKPSEREEDPEERDAPPAAVSSPSPSERGRPAISSPKPSETERTSSPPPPSPLRSFGESGPPAVFEGRREEEEAVRPRSCPAPGASQTEIDPFASLASESAADLPRSQLSSYLGEDWRVLFVAGELDKKLFSLTG